MKELSFGIRDLCRHCKHSEVKNEIITCKNKKSDFYNKMTNALIMSPCFEGKDKDGPTTVKKVYLGG